MGEELPKRSFTLLEPSLLTWPSFCTLVCIRLDIEEEEEDAVAIRAQCAANSNASNPLPIIAMVAPCDTAILDNDRTVSGSSMGSIVDCCMIVFVAEEDDFND